MERLDLVQFHWWDYAVPGCVEAALWLKELQQEGKIDLLGGTNFDTPHTSELLASGRAAGQHAGAIFAARCAARARAGRALPRARHSSPLLRLGGGRLPERCAGSESAEPKPPFENRSLTKYKLIIDDFGGWDAVPGAARSPAADRRPPRQSTSRRSPAAPCSIGRRSPPSSSARASDSHLPPIWRSADLRSSPATIAPRSTRCWRAARAGRRYLRARARPRGPPRLDHEIQSQQAGLMTPLADRRGPRDRRALHASSWSCSPADRAIFGRCAAAFSPQDFEMVTPDGACLDRGPDPGAPRTAAAAPGFPHHHLATSRPICEDAESGLAPIYRGTVS